ncbi:hypothetical protein IJX73_02825 [bacterium]|nr:hypothetical protein [bacterium]
MKNTIENLEIDVAAPFILEKMFKILVKTPDKKYLSSDLPMLLKVSLDAKDELIAKLEKDKEDIFKQTAELEEQNNKYIDDLEKIIEIYKNQIEYLIGAIVVFKTDIMKLYGSGVSETLDKIDEVLKCAECNQKTATSKEKQLQTLSFKISVLLNEAEFKLEALPQKYFIDYFEEEFLRKIRSLLK